MPLNGKVRATCANDPSVYPFSPFFTCVHPKPWALLLEENQFRHNVMQIEVERRWRQNLFCAHRIAGQRSQHSAEGEIYETHVHGRSAFIQIQNSNEWWWPIHHGALGVALSKWERLTSTHHNHPSLANLWENETSNVEIIPHRQVDPMETQILIFFVISQTICFQQH